LKIPNDKKKQILADKDLLSINQISKKYNLPRAEIENIINPPFKKTPKWFYAVLFSVPILFLIAAEIFFRSS